MPPKAEKKKPNVKEQQKKLQKVIEDKTFGMKNKKGAKAQKYIQSLQNQVQGNQRQLQQQQQAKKKKEEMDEMRDLGNIFKPVQEMPKIADDVDPKSVLCVFFKQGLCTKGKKCKFSHDLSVQQKTAKRNLYVDSRDLKDGALAEAETNENWDENQLNEVAEKKHGEKDRKRPNQTDIVCKYFVEAVENNKYGWFWECPNGEKCIYRHALPPGYILSKDKKKMDEQKRLNQISLEELIEKERANLSGKNQTKVTLETFTAWKKKKLCERRQQATQDEVKKRTNAKAGKQAGLTGRELFMYTEQLNTDEQDDEGGSVFVREKEEIDDLDGIKAFEIDEKTFMNFGEDGAMIDIDDEEPEETQKPGPSNPIVFDESVFNADDLENLDDIPDESDDEDVEDQIQSKLKI